MRRVAGWAGCWFLAVLAFVRAAPQIGGTGGMDSDEAITQLMANARWLNPFGFYFWGQDRLGAWPYLIEWVLHRATGLGWSYRGLYAVLALCVLSAAWPLSRVAGWWGWCAASAVLAFLVGDEHSRQWFLRIGQPYAWQLSTFFWAWWCVHRQALADVTGEIRLRAIRSRRWWSFVAPAVFASLLSIWSSPLSAPFLWIAAIAETARVPSGLRRRRLWARLCGTILIAVVLEQLIRVTQQRYSAWRHWRIFFTEVRVDRGHMVENLAAYAHQLRTEPGWPIVAGALLVFVAWAAVRLFRLRLPSQVRDDLRIAVACVAMGTLNLATLGFLSWGRVNDYSGRYLLPTWILWVVGDVGLLATAVELVPRAAGRRIVAVAAAAMLAACAFLMPPGEHSAEAETRARVARELPERMPGGILFGCYWGTYSLIDASDPHAMTPVVHHAATHRTPWTPPLMKVATEVVVAHEQCPPVGPVDDPTPFVFDRGVLLHLKTPGWFRDGPFGFSLYENRSSWLLYGKVSRGGQPVRLDADAPLPLDRPAFAPGQEAFTVTIDHPASQLLLFFSVRGSQTARMPALRAEGLLPDGTVRGLVLTPGEHFAIVPFGGLRLASVRLIQTGTQEPLSQLEAVALVPEQGPT